METIDTIPYSVSDKQIIHALIKISALITEQYKLTELYKKLHAIISEVVFAKNIAIAEIDSESHIMNITYFVDEKDGNKFYGKKIDIGRGLSAYAIKRQAPTRLNEQQIIELQNKGEIDRIYGTMCKSWIGVPIVDDGTVIGLIIVQSYTSEYVYSERDLEVLTFVGSNINILVKQKKIVEEEKLLRAEILQKDKMASLGGLVAGVAHEINTPLGVCVTGISNLLEEHVRFRMAVDAGTVTEKQFNNFVDDVGETCEIIKSNVNRAATLISSFKQIAVDQSSESKRVINIKTYLEEIIHSLHPIIRKTKHKIVIDCADDIESLTHPGAISQLFTNLITNSLIHGFEDIESGTIEIKVSKKKGNLEFIYSDNGKGMNKEQKKKFFEPFYTTKRGSGGSGLGGHIIFNIVATSLHGNVVLESHKAKGAQFTITFPS